jgi:Holliday junction DNA helicase RuvB
MRFPIREHLEFYDSQDLARIVTRAAHREGLRMTRDAALMVAEAGRGTPREALALTVRVADAAEARGRTQLRPRFVRETLEQLGIDRDGLTALDRRYIDTLQRRGADRPVGLARLAALLGESRRTLRDIVEPFLSRRGLIHLTPRGRIVAA